MPDLDDRADIAADEEPSFVEHEDENATAENAELLEQITAAGEDAANNFDFWMKKYNHPDGVSDRQNALRWLHYNSGHIYVAGDYYIFRVFCYEAAEKGYKTLPPPMEVEFNYHMNLVRH